MFHSLSLSLSLTLTHYTKLELPWQPKTAKEYTKTAKKIILGGWPLSKIRHE